MTSDQKYLYIGMFHSKCIARYTLDNLQLVDKFMTKDSPCGLDISDNELYVYDWDTTLKVFNISSKAIVRQWKTPKRSHGIKIFNGNLFYVCDLEGSIYVYNLSGNLQKKFGYHGSLPGEFKRPYGIDIADNFIYIVDQNNHRIQVFHLENYTYSRHWRVNGIPYEIRVYDGLCYVGDRAGIQVFLKDGEFVCRYGQTISDSGYCNVTGILIHNDRLYISDSNNGRLVVLK